MIIDHLHNFVNDLYRNKFFKLFFHWSWQVRNMFYYFILFFLNHKIKNMLLPKSKSYRRSYSNESLTKQDNYSENVTFPIFF